MKLKRFLALVIILLMVSANSSLVFAADDWKMAYREVLAGYDSSCSFAMLLYREENIPLLVIEEPKNDWRRTTQHLYSYHNSKVINHEDEFFDNWKMWMSSADDRNKFSLTKYVIDDKVVAFNALIELDTGFSGDFICFFDDSTISLLYADSFDFSDGHATFYDDYLKEKIISIIPEEVLNSYTRGKYSTNKYDNLKREEIFLIPIAFENIEKEFAKWNLAKPEDSQISVLINGVKQSFEVPPQLVNGRSMLPLRAICEALGIDVDYDNASDTATMTKDSLVVVHKTGTSSISVNGVETNFDASSFISEGRTLVPVRMLGEAIGAEVEWVEETSTVVISKK